MGLGGDAGGGGAIMPHGTEVAPALAQALRTFSDSGEIGPLRELLAADVVWRNPGGGSLSGAYRGPSEVGALLKRMRDETEGSLKLDIRGTCVIDGMIVVVAHATAARDGKRLAQDVVTTYRIDREGKIAERRLFLEDSDANDEFWS
jgi:ketosteroid isomerase-like protein